MYNCVKTISDLSEENQLSFIATKEIRMIAAYEMLNVRAYQMKIGMTLNTEKRVWVALQSLREYEE